MTPIHVFVPGDPRGQPRPRAFYRKGLGVRVYDAGTAEGWKSQVALAMRHGIASVPTADPVRLELRFVLARPKSHYDKAGIVRKRMPRSHTAKPDVDNLAKAVLDAIQHLGVWVDDAQVTELLVTKRWSSSTLDASGCQIHLATVTP